MFELKYKITERDLKDANFKVALKYFIAYLVVSLAGIGIGVAAIVTRPSTTLFVMGIILAILGGLLLVCSAMLMISPKSFVLSVLTPSEELERTVTISDKGVTISSDGPNAIELSYYDIIKVKNHKKYLLAYLDKAQALVIKDAVVSGGTLAELFAFLQSKLNSRGPLIESNAEKAAEKANVPEEKGESESVQSDSDEA